MENKETHRFIVPKKGTTRYELFEGYGYAEMKWTAIGVGVGLVVLFVVVGIQNIVFPYKEVSIDSIPYGVEFIKTKYPDVVLVERKIPSLVKTAIVLFFGALFTFPNMKMTAQYTWREMLSLQKNFKASQQLFQFKKSKWY